MFPWAMWITIRPRSGHLGEILTLSHPGRTQCDGKSIQFTAYSPSHNQPSSERPLETWERQAERERVREKGTSSVLALTTG